MANIHLHAGSTASVTCVSNYFIDHFLKSLSGDAVRVYLTLLRCLGDSEEGFSISLIAQRLGISAREVRTSLDTLASSGLIGLDYDSEGELCDICVKECRVSEEPQEKASSDVEVPVEYLSSSMQAGAAAPQEEVQSESMADGSEEDVPEMKDRTDDGRDDPEVKQIMFIAQRYFGRSLSHMDLQMILYWYYDLHMDSDMIDYLITSNIDNGKTSVAYMNKVAIAWWKKGIRTSEQASLEQKQFSTETNTVRRAFGITGHVMTPAELDYIDRWFHEWGFTPDMVREACERTIIRTGSPNYAYAESILDNWHKKGITSVEQISDDDEQHKKENQKKYTSRASQQSVKNGFSFSETNNYDDNKIASMLLRHNNSF